MSVVSNKVGIGAQSLLDAAWDIRTSTSVPEAEEIVLKNGGVRIDATYLFADMAHSSTLAQLIKDEVAAKVFRVYLNAATQLLLHRGGAIRSFDGDRVMAIFVGAEKNRAAVQAAMHIQWAVHRVLRPKLLAKWHDIGFFGSEGVCGPRLRAGALRT